MQAEAARHLGVSTATVLGWEKRGREPAIRQWPAILAFLSCDPHPEPQTTAGRLMSVRRRRGWSQKKLARDLGVDPTSVARWEAGHEPRNRRSREAVEDLLAQESGRLGGRRAISRWRRRSLSHSTTNSGDAPARPSQLLPGVHSRAQLLRRTALEAIHGEERDPVVLSSICRSRASVFDMMTCPSMTAPSIAELRRVAPRTRSICQCSCSALEPPSTV